MDQLDIWLQSHLAKRSGERRRRLLHGFEFGEQLLLQKILLPVLGSFADLHPEYEVRIRGERPMFLDFAFIRGGVKFNFELDGYQYHAIEIDRYKFGRERRRDMKLTVEGWRVFRFSYDDVMERSDELTKWMKRVFAQLDHQLDLHPLQKEIIKYAWSKRSGIVKVVEIQKFLQIGKDWNLRLLKELVEHGVLDPAGKGTVRISRYRLQVEHAIVQRVMWG